MATPKKKGSSDKLYAKELLKISTALLNNITSKDLLRTIYDIIKPIFPFDEAGLFVIDHDRDVFYEILEEGVLNQSDLQDFLATNDLLGPFAYSGNHPDTFFYADAPTIFSIEAQSEIYPHPQWELMKAHGLKEMIVGPLIVNDKKIGFFCFNSKEEGFYSEKDFKLFEAIGNQLAIAVSNLVADEQLLEEKRFKETLLGISEAVATIQDRKELFQVIFKKIKPIIPIDDVAIVVLNEKEEWQDWAVLDNYLETDHNKILEEAGLGGYHAMDSLVKKVTSTIGILSIDEIKQNHPDCVFDFDWKECLYAPLKSGGKTIGSIILDAHEYNTYSNDYFPLISAIADQLAVAVSNILANEELLLRQKRIEDLLKISTAATKIKNRGELLKVIFETIKPIFPFNTAGIFIIDFENDLHYDLLDAVEILGANDSTQVELIEKNLLGSFKHSGSGIDYVTRTGEPIVFNIKKDGKKWPHPQLEVMYNAGLRELLCVPLKSANETFGMFCVNSETENFFSEDDFGFFKTISEQVGLAVKNIVANEEVLLQKQRLENLLNISTAATKIKNRSELLEVIFKTIKPIFPFDSAGLFIIDKEQNEHYEILDDIAILGDEDISQKELITSNLLGRFRHKDSAVDFLSSGDHPRLFTIKKDGEKWPHPQFEIMYSAGLRQIIGIGLRSGKETFGMLCFNAKQEDFFSEKDFPFFQAISEQVALAVRDLLAKEQLLQEKQKVENLLKTSEAISAIASEKELINILFGIIRKVFPFEEVGFFALDFENKLEKDYIIDYAQVSDVSENIHNAGLSGWKQMSKVAAHFAEKTPVIYEVSKLYEHFDHPDFEFTKKEPFTSIIGGPLKNSERTIGMLCFWTKNKEGYRQKDIPLFKSISDQLGIALDNLTKKEQIVKLNQELKLERDYLIEEVKIEHNFEEIIGNSPLLREVFKSVEMVSHTDATVLVEGETGTGKELIARAIHNRSDRKKKPMVKVNCATLPKELIESELFGHEKGSFTGAFERRIGKFELANKSTLFLDEVGEMPLELQAKLLRAIQEKEIERLGGNETIKVDVRIIAATNRNLLEESEKGEFRSDLYYRLNVFPIRMPALRERIEDIPLLATFFAQKYCNKLNVNFKGIKEKSMQELLEYYWPGNIRELENLVEQACILNQGKALSWARELVPAKPKRRVSKEEQDYENFDIKAIKAEQENKERETILEVLKKTKWRIRGEKGAAKLLGIKPTTLEYRMTKLGLK